MRNVRKKSSENVAKSSQKHLLFILNMKEYVYDSDFLYENVKFLSYTRFIDQYMQECEKIFFRNIKKFNRTLCCQNLSKIILLNFNIVENMLQVW